MLRYCQWDNFPDLNTSLFVFVYRKVADLGDNFVTSYFAK